MSQEIQDLINIMKTLRDPEKGCPWDREQTHTSLKRYILEESYETLEAIDLIDKNGLNDARANQELKEELGDLLLQIVYHSNLAEERSAFSFEDVVIGIKEKMLRRHPHVFGKEKAESVSDVNEHWDKIKKEEKKHRKSIYEGIPKELPSLARAWLISKKAVKESFEWDEETKLWEQLNSEIKEFKEAIQDENASKKDAELELGDILFTVVNIARWHKIDPEEALRLTNNKFTDRFDLMVSHIKKKHPDKQLKDFTPSKLEEFWQIAKRIQNGKSVL